MAMTARLGGSAMSSHYVDDGCEVSPKCLECPLPLCRYDDPQGFENWRRRAKRTRDRAMILARVNHGTTAEELAKEHGIVPRTVFRILAKG